MALSPLITSADLSARSITADGATGADIASASAAIREHAGPITIGTGTIVVPGTRDQWLSLPVQPITAVSSVLIGETAVTDWRLIGGRLWRALGWWTICGPEAVTVTLTYGLATVPADIVDLACSLVAGAQREREQGSHRGVAYERGDDYQIGYLQDAAAERVSAFELPERTKAMLRERFGGGAYVTGES